MHETHRCDSSLLHTRSIPAFTAHLWRCSELSVSGRGRIKGGAQIAIKIQSFAVGLIYFFLLAQVRRGGGGSKTVFSGLSIWIWLTAVAGQEIQLKCRVNYNAPALDVFISLLSPGREECVSERDTEETLQWEKSQNIHGAVAITPWPCRARRVGRRKVT